MCSLSECVCGVRVCRVSCGPWMARTLTAASLCRLSLTFVVWHLSSLSSCWLNCLTLWLDTTTGRRPLSSVNASCHLFLVCWSCRFVIDILFWFILYSLFLLHHLRETCKKIIITRPSLCLFLITGTMASKTMTSTVAHQKSLQSFAKHASWQWQDLNWQWQTVPCTRTGGRLSHALGLVAVEDRLPNFVFILVTCRFWESTGHVAGWDRLTEHSHWQVTLAHSHWDTCGRASTTCRQHG